MCARDDAGGTNENAEDSWDTKLERLCATTDPQSRSLASPSSAAMASSTACCASPRSRNKGSTGLPSSPWTAISMHANSGNSWPSGDAPRRARGLHTILRRDQDRGARSMQLERFAEAHGHDVQSQGRVLLLRRFELRLCGVDVRIQQRERLSVGLVLQGLALLVRDGEDRQPVEQRLDARPAGGAYDGVLRFCIAFRAQPARRPAVAGRRECADVQRCSYEEEAHCSLLVRCLAAPVAREGARSQLVCCGDQWRFR